MLDGYYTLKKNWTKFSSMGEIDASGVSLIAIICQMFSEPDENIDDF